SMTSSEDDYVVNGKSSMPSVLLEMGFMSSPTDNRLFKDNLAGYAEAIAQAILQWAETQPY
ncbi:MAG: N-acetylmuramoyl-L-alanine amidase, partial [Lachnospiraceae bacterium]|nr:N-acetylmuramoyl-L-alanine amidase [Lachnospiraceae bacterium]